MDWFAMRTRAKKFVCLKSTMKMTTKTHSQRITMKQFECQHQKQFCMYMIILFKRINNNWQASTCNMTIHTHNKHQKMVSYASSSQSSSPPTCYQNIISKCKLISSSPFQPFLFHSLFPTMIIDPWFIDSPCKFYQIWCKFDW